jgi:hypothetical protein
VAPKTDLLDPDALKDISSRLLYLAAGDHRQIKYLIRIPENTPRLIEIPSRPNSYVRGAQPPPSQKIIAQFHFR